MSDPQPVELAKTWLKLFEGCIRQKNFRGVRDLFHKHVVTFGQAGSCITGIEDTVNLEFKETWPDQVAFTFDLATARIIPMPGALAVAVQWWHKPKIIGAADTQGRATIFLAEFSDTKEVKCVHIHLSRSLAGIIKPT